MKTVPFQFLHSQSDKKYVKRLSNTMTWLHIYYGIDPKGSKLQSKSVLVERYHCCVKVGFNPTGHSWRHWVWHMSELSHRMSRKLGIYALSHITGWELSSGTSVLYPGPKISPDREILEDYGSPRNYCASDLRGRLMEGSSDTVNIPYITHFAQILDYLYLLFIELGFK